MFPDIISIEAVHNGEQIQVVTRGPGGICSRSQMKKTVQEYIEGVLRDPNILYGECVSTNDQLIKFKVEIPFCKIMQINTYIMENKTLTIIDTGKSQIKIAANIRDIKKQWDEWKAKNKNKYYMEKPNDDIERYDILGYDGSISREIICYDKATADRILEFLNKEDI